MEPSREYLELQCDCGWRESLGVRQITGWLRKLGKLRPGREPEEEILYELFRAAVPQLACPQCGGRTLQRVAASRDEWSDEPLCESCRRPIPAERRQAIPGTRRCAACQGNEEAGRLPAEVEYCPRCGSPLALRLSRRAGLARYVMVCTAHPPCRSVK